MPRPLALELARAAYVTVRDLLKIKPGESLLITTDSVNEWEPAEEIAKAGEALGAKVMVAWHTTPSGYGKVTDAGVPDSLKAAIPETDAWVELNNQWLLYSTAWQTAMLGGRVRYLFYGGLDSEQLARCVGKINIEAQRRFQDAVVGRTRATRHMRITTPVGTDVEFDNDPNRPVTNELFADTPGPHFLLGQIGWAPREETINGRIVFDGSFSGGGEAEIGLLHEPITYHVEAGRIKSIEGGTEAQIVRQWFEKLADERMYVAAHVCYGFNPGAKLTGLCTEDERVWGSTEWGFGYQGTMYTGGAPRDAASHADAICLHSSVWLDGQMILDEGRVVDPQLAELAHLCGR